MPFPVKQLLLAVAALLLSGIPASGAGFPVEQVQQDFSVKKARLIAGPEQQHLINKGRRAGIKKGDFFSLYPKGRAVVDPDTGETLGSLADAVAICQVVRVHANFAELAIKWRKNDNTLQPGLEAVRYRGVAALFMDKSGAFFSDYLFLRARLDHLDWQGYRQASDKGAQKDQARPQVVFAPEADRLAVWGGDELLAVYPAGVEAPGDGASGPETGKGGMPSGRVAEIETQKPAVLARLDREVDHFGVTTASDGQKPFLVFLGGRDIVARALEGGATFRYDYTGFGEPVHMSVGSRGLVAVNIFVPGEGMRSKILELSDSGFRNVAGDINYALAFMGGPADDGRPRLRAQRFSLADLLMPVVYRMSLEDDTVSREENLAVPRGYHIFAAFSADLNGNGVPESGFFNPGGRLVLHESGRRQWQSPSRFSGSRSTFLVGDPEDPAAAPRQVSVFRQPVVFEHQGAFAAACVLNKAGAAGVFGRQPGPAIVGILRSSGGSYRLHLLEEPFFGKIRGVSVYRDQLLVCESENADSHKQGRTRILAFPVHSLMSP